MEQLLKRPDILCGGIIGIGMLGFLYLRARLAGREINSPKIKPRSIIINPEQEHLDEMRNMSKYVNKLHENQDEAVRKARSLHQQTKKK